MTMQRDDFVGEPIGLDRPERFEARMKRIRADMLHKARLKANDDSPWFAARVMSGHEISVKNSLVDEKIEALVPMRMGPEYRRRGRVMPARSIPVMTSYVLVRFMPSSEAFLGLRSIDGVIDMLGGCDYPHRISDREVKRFMRLADDGSLDYERPVMVFAKDEKIRVGDGPLTGFGGTIVSCRSDGKGDAVVELQMFGQTRPVLIPLAMLEKV